MHSVDFKITIDDNRARENLLQNLDLELQDTGTDRGSVRIAELASQLHIVVEAEDLVMLRALSNSVLRIMKTSLEIIDILSEE